MSWRGCCINIFRTVIVFLLWGLVLAPGLVGAREAAPLARQDLLVVKKQIEDGWFSYDKAATERLLDRILNHIDMDPAAWHPHYFAGLVNIKLGNILRAADKNAAYDRYTAALKHVKTAYDRSPGVENTIVLADAYGKLASMKTVKMIYFGGKSKSYLIEAFQKNMYSPKNHLMAGIEIMWTPPIFGGSKQRAREFLERALALAPQWQEPDPLIVNWATRPEIFAHLAQLEILCDAPDEARNYVEMALQQVPEFDFVRRDIIPQLE